MTQSGDGRPSRAKHDLHHALSMPTAEARTPQPTYGDVGQLEQPLNRAVLAVRSVQHRKDHVEAQSGERVAASARRRGRPAIDDEDRVVAGPRRQNDFAAAAQRASRRCASVRSRRRPTRPTADDRRAPSVRPSRSGSRRARSAADRDWRRPPPPRPATLRARQSGRRTARRREDVSRGSIMSSVMFEVRARSSKSESLVGAR